MRSPNLTNRHIAVLRAAPIGIDDDDNDDPQRGGRWRYQGADGRLARGLWLRDLLEYRPVGFDGKSGGLLHLTEAGRQALADANPTPSSQSDRSRP